MQRLPPKPAIRDAPVRLPQPGKLVEHCLGAGKVEALRTDTLRNLTDDAPVGVLVALRPQRRIEKLHSPLDVRVRAISIGECHRRQHDIGNLGQFIGEHILHQQELQLLSGFNERAKFTVCAKRATGENGTVADHMQRLHLPALDSFGQSQDAHALVRRQLRAPHLGEPSSRLAISHCVIAGQVLRRAAYILRSLLVRAEEQRIQSGGWLAEITSYQRQVRKRARAVLTHIRRKRLQRVQDRAGAVARE